MNRRALILVGLALPFLGFASPAAAQDARELARISAYLNSITTLAGHFVQIDPDGILSEGKFYMSRPGRIRFEYDEPNPALVVADGTWVGVVDKRYDQVNRYPLNETPLNLILRADVNLGREGAVEGIEVADGQMRVRARDPDHPERGSITMIFGANPLELRQWIIDDAQGGSTTVALSDMRANVGIDPSQFVIPKRGGQKVDR
ncbi:outer membrane lipoprotein carrier protein LolA [Pikeienuella piscinae]|uniref:Outer membrane lipoprotein carrier protein LolA n=1 Tax=Pikeienuella piscinae TaxID=2748098 RepID=A0A7L5BWK7_9RHOB|nr:outer membrane lipoprotein carrier protein LolA [Pikeienuella piscinae]QIE56275.1 outer membrane lipoprotein carrier protein LolA [Pikeienuella piscinae]